VQCTVVAQCSATVWHYMNSTLVQRGEGMPAGSAPCAAPCAVCPVYSVLCTPCSLCYVLRVPCALGPVCSAVGRSGALVHGLRLFSCCL